MAYTPISQRNNQSNKSGYTPVRQRTTTPEIDLRDPLGVRAKINRATANIRQRERQAQIPGTPESIQRLSQRDMSQDVIRAAPDTRSPLKKVLDFTGLSDTKLVQSFERNVQPQLSQVREFLFPTLSEEMFRLSEEKPDASIEELRKEAEGTLVAGGTLPVGDDTVIDFTGGLGGIVRRLPKAIGDAILSAKNTDEATQVIRNIGIESPDEQLISRVVNAKSVEDVDDVVQKIGQQLPGTYTPVRNRTESTPQQTLEDLAQKRDDVLVIKTDKTFDNKPVKSVSTDSLLARDIADVGAEDPKQIQKVVDDIEAGKQIEPLRVQVVDDVIYVEDGKHRLEAARRLGIDTIDVVEEPIKRVKPKTPTQPPRVQIDAEIKEIRDAITRRSTNVEEIDQLETRISILEDALQRDPASQLTKYVSRSIGRLPEVTGTDTIQSLTGSGRTVKNSTFGKRGDDIVTELGFEDVNDAQRALDQYQAQREALTELRDSMRTKKESRALANKAIKVTRAATQGRRSYVKELRDQFLLKDSDIKKAARGGDFRTMSDSSFDDFIARLEQRAVEVADTRQAKAELVDLLERRHFEKVENYRRTQGFPPVSQMNAQQLRDYANALEQFQTGDEFLTPRQLEVVDRSDLKGIKTTREARERLLEQVKKMPGMENTSLEDLQNIKVSAMDNLRYDTALAEKNPYYNFVVNRTQTHMLTAEAHFLDVQNKVNELARAANKSRNRGALGTVRQALIPKNEEVVQYLEAPMSEKKAFAAKLTPEELDYANYIQQYYSEAYDHLVKVKELYGSRYVDQYFTHVKRDFLEAWSDDGFVKAMREWWQTQKEDQVIANIIDQDTGNILPKAKFFQYTLQRTGEVTPSKNVTRVFLQYAQTFERKKMFDAMIPEIDIYTQSLTPKQLTPKGLEMDRSLKTLINKYLNNKKGRRENFGDIIKQSGPADILIRMGNTLVSLIDLGFALGPSLAANVGEQVMTYQALGKIGYTKAWKRRIWDAGIKRLGNKNANKILEEAEPFIGRNIWTELSDPGQGVMDRGLKTVFGAFSQSTVEANKLFLLGNISKAELKAGKLSAGRLAQLRLEAGRWRDLGRDVKSIVGSTSVGEMSTKYKGWAIPIARTNIKNVTELANGLRRGQFKETLTSREAAETYRAIELSTVLVMVGAYVLSEEEDDTFIGQLKARAYMEAMTLLGGIDPEVFLSTPRLYSFLQQLGTNLKNIATLEQYQQDSRWGEAGDLKGVKGLQRQLTPSAFEQFGSSAQTTSSGGTGGADFGFGDISGGGDIEDIDFGFDELDFGFDEQ